MLHYNPRHVSSITMLIYRRSNCIITASGIITLCKWLYSMLVESILKFVNETSLSYRQVRDCILSCKTPKLSRVRYFVYIINEKLLKLKHPDCYCNIICCKIFFHTSRTLEVLLHSHLNKTSNVRIT
jgi:hypothetical protein